MNPKDHYDKHLGYFYSWMLGDWETKQTEFSEFLKTKSLGSKGKEVAIDLGAGNGIHSLALSQLGYSVVAVDFNKQLLKELNENAETQSHAIEIVEDDILTVAKFQYKEPTLLLCMGDTITHLSSKEEIKEFLKSCYECLKPNGKLLLSFRDYSQTLEGDSRFIPVRSDDTKIHTCILEYEEYRIRVTDQLYTKKNNLWEMSISSYFKVRLQKEECLLYLEELGFQIEWTETYQRMITILAKK